MSIKEFVEKINAYCKEHGIYEVCDLENEDIYEDLQALNFHFITSVDSDEHRWYVLADNVYGVTIDGKDYYIGTWEVETLKSECMTVADCDCVLEFVEMEQYTTVSYRCKKG